MPSSKYNCVTVQFQECCSGGDLAPSLGWDGKFFRGPNFLNDVLGEKFHFLVQKF